MAEVGKREVRVDAFDKATGRTKYYEDLMPREALYVRASSTRRSRTGWSNPWTRPPPNRSTGW